MAAVHKKFLNRLREENASESGESESASTTYKPTIDEDTDARTSVESETDSTTTTRDKTESPVSESSTTSDEAKDTCSSDENNDSSSEKLTIAAPSIEENIFVKSEQISPSIKNGSIHEESQPPIDDASSVKSEEAYSARENINDSSAKIEQDQNEKIMSPPPGSNSVGHMKSSLLVHPAPTYNYSSSRSEAIARNQTQNAPISLPHAQQPLIVDQPAQQSKSSFQRQNSSDDSYKPSSSSSPKKDDYNSTSPLKQNHPHVPMVRSVGSEILRSAITGNLKPLDNQNSRPVNGGKYTIVPHRSYRSDNGYSGSSISTNVHHLKYNGGPSHAANSSSASNRSIRAHVIHRSPQHPHRSHQLSQRTRFESPSPTRQTHSHMEQQPQQHHVGSSSYPRSPNESPKHGMPHKYSHQSTSGRPNYQVVHQAPRSGIPTRRLSEGSPPSGHLRSSSKHDEAGEYFLSYAKIGKLLDSSFLHISSNSNYPVPLFNVLSEAFKVQFFVSSICITYYINPCFFQCLTSNFFSIIELHEEFHEED